MCVPVSVCVCACVLAFMNMLTHLGHYGPSDDVYFCADEIEVIGALLASVL
jgi:hypothetical protein